MNDMNSKLKDPSSQKNEPTTAVHVKVIQVVVEGDVTERCGHRSTSEPAMQPARSVDIDWLEIAAT